MSLLSVALHTMYLTKMYISVLFPQFTRWPKRRLGRSKPWFVMMLLHHCRWLLDGRVSIRLLLLFVSRDFCGC